MVTPSQPTAFGSAAASWASAVLYTRAGKLSLAVAAVALLALPGIITPGRSSGGGFLSIFSSEDPYAATPFCSPDGKCGEEADAPSPRTVFSARSRSQFDDWLAFHEVLDRSAEEYAARRRKEKESGGATAAAAAAGSGAGTKRPLILLGDSITESYLGTELGRPLQKFADVPPVLSEVYGGGFDPLVLGASGDQTQHLLCRLENGQLLPGYADDPDAVFVALIGTNNLGAGHLPGPAAKGVLAVAEYVLGNTAGKLVLVEVLPRGDSERVERLCPPRCDSNGEPFASFMPAVRKVNMELRNAVPTLSEKYGGRFSLVDCGRAFLPEEKGAASGARVESSEEVNIKFMPDRLHPNAEGHRLLARCVLKCVGGKC